ncbi:Beta-galactosidase [Cytospora mali]|nr:Beta-galactosidase [Valsa mali var. pyri (nom. inval.)]
MRLHTVPASAILVLAYRALVLPFPAAASSVAAPAFTYNNNSFLLHGEPYVIVGGQMDPQRIPPEYWRDRLSKARAMGLNTIFSYVYWNLLEPDQGQWLGNKPSNDIAEYFRIAREEGLHTVLRPGPYICGEREWGGFPAWLATVPGLVVRTYNEPFLNYSKSYLERLAADLRPMQVTQGGPLLMVQVENEYGSYGSNHKYTQAMKDILLENFDVPLYTNDGGVEFTLVGGTVPGVLAEIDGDPSSGFAARDQYVTDVSELGPLLDGEYYTLAPDTWGSDNTHITADGNPSTVDQFVKDLNIVLGSNNSISLYMFHGGTNFALSNGALWKNHTAAFTTSYDYGSPLDESGRTTDYYFTLRDTIQSYFPDESIPEPAANIPRMSISNITLSPRLRLFDTTAATAKNDSPITMEHLGQNYGFVLYEHQATHSISGLLQPGDRPRDRVIVYVNGSRVGVIDSIYQYPRNITVDLQSGDILQLLVENLGRVDYWSLEAYTFDGLTDPYKGIVDEVTIGNTTINGWTMTSLPVDGVPSFSSKGNISANGATPMFYSGTFEVDGNYSDPMRLDTFLAIPNGVKGVVWVNNFNLGRYWTIGPQQSLYLPGTVLKVGQTNEIVVLELEPGNQTMIARGEPERIWGNNPDPDYL